jgi:hypothetical protein
LLLMGLNVGIVVVKFVCYFLIVFAFVWLIISRSSIFLLWLYSFGCFLYGSWSPFVNLTMSNHLQQTSFLQSIGTWIWVLIISDLEDKICETWENCDRRQGKRYIRKDTNTVKYGIVCTIQKAPKIRCSFKKMHIFSFSLGKILSFMCCEIWGNFKQIHVNIISLNAFSVKLLRHFWKHSLRKILWVLNWILTQNLSNWKWTGK